jgi:muconolactone delta-isomerase
MNAVDAGDPNLAEFLVHVEIQTPPDMPAADVDGLRTQEAARGRTLAARGSLIRLWRIPGRWGNWGYWRAESLDALNELLRSLPLYPFMTVEVHPLDPHPSDPSPADVAGANQSIVKPMPGREDGVAMPPRNSGPPTQSS